MKKANPRRRAKKKAKKKAPRKKRLTERDKLAEALERECENARQHGYLIGYRSGRERASAEILSYLKAAARCEWIERVARDAFRELAEHIERVNSKGLSFSTKTPIKED